jgi:glutamate dehydrogenase
VAGVGDMSGDVFGNGMLLSPVIRLVAAFDHRHIFLDPSPDPAVAFAERQRLFALPTSSWADYDATLLSWGGGIFPRSAKSVALTPEVRALLEIEDEALAPAELIRAILKAPVELLYFGGIGCYVKAPTETNAEVMDKANDAVRVDGPELRAKVVGEGANLGVTQAGRISYARSGGRINTDAIDNSAGVDTSDHEVNIKILLRAAERSGKLKPEDRLELLARMTEEVGEHVLVHNYAQTLTLSLQEATAAQDIDAHARFMDDLAARGRLDRKVEGLPSAKAMAELKAQGSGLTRPELAVLTAYGKLELSADLEAGAAPDDSWFEQALEDYFPTALGQFPIERRGHQLRREIIATVMSNAMVDMCGPTFPFRMGAALGAEPALIAASFEGARRIFRLDEIWAEIGALDLKISADAQTRLYRETARVLRAQAYWIASKAAGGAAPAIGPLIERYRPCADALRAAAGAILSPFEREQAEARRAAFIAAGAPEALARRVAALGPLTATIEAADLAQALEWPDEAAAQLLHATGAAFGFDRLKAVAAALPRGDLYERMALRRLIAEFIAEQTQIARSVAAGASAPPKSYEQAAKLAAAWTAARREETDRALAGLRRMETDGEPWSFARLTLANAALRDVANS